MRRQVFLVAALVLLMAAEASAQASEDDMAPLLAAIEKFIEQQGAAGESMPLHFLIDSTGTETAAAAFLGAERATELDSLLLSEGVSAEICPGRCKADTPYTDIIVSFSKPRLTDKTFAGEASIVVELTAEGIRPQDHPMGTTWGSITRYYLVREDGSWKVVESESVVTS